MQIKNNSTQTNIHVYDAMRVDEEEEVAAEIDILDDTEIPKIIGPNICLCKIVIV